jgi:MFS transporter, MHS family, proline/betaine transporter
VRPLGALLSGHIGDRSGRQAALTLSVLAMAVPTSLIGVLPDHAQIGITASVLLVGLRLVQGVSVGGENPTEELFLAVMLRH